MSCADLRRDTARLVPREPRASIHAARQCFRRRLRARFIASGDANHTVATARRAKRDTSGVSEPRGRTPSERSSRRD